jgi:uncharacterized protein (TIGR02284 family)
METDKCVDVLNSLIEINNDRVEGYETAAKETNDQSLKSLFAGLKSTSESILAELRSEVGRLHGEVEEGTRTTGKFFRTWMDVKAALTGGNRHAILSSCEYGEDNALEVYQHVLEEHNTDLTAEELSMVRSQYAKLHADHDRVKALRDAA